MTLGGCCRQLRSVVGQRSTLFRWVSSGASTSSHGIPPLRQALASRLCCTRRPLRRDMVYQSLVDPSRLVEELHRAKTSRRLGKQHMALRFLRRHNLLLHSLLFFEKNTGNWNTTVEFDRLALLGESILHAEVQMRLLQLLPDVSSSVYTDVVRTALHPDAYVAVFDTLQLHTLVGRKPEEVEPAAAKTSNPQGSSSPSTLHSSRQRAVLLSPDEKRFMLCAIIGEMHWFTARTKPTDRTHNNALFPPSDVLILHVLCGHLLECFPAEFLYRHIEPELEVIRQSWSNADMSVPDQLRLRPRTPGVFLLSTAPVDGSRAKERDHRLVAVPKCTSTPQWTVTSHMQPQCNHKHFDLMMNHQRGVKPVLEKPRSTPWIQERSDPVRGTLPIQRHLELMRSASATSAVLT